MFDRDDPRDNARPATILMLDETTQTNQKLDTSVAMGVYFQNNSYVVNGVSIIPNEIFNALDLGQAGDAMLFAKIFRNTYRYDCSVHSWYVYDSAIHSWRKDVTRETLDAFKKIFHIYKKEALRQKDRMEHTLKERKMADQEFNIAYGLAEKRYADLCYRMSEINTSSYRKEVLKLASSGSMSLALHGHEWDQIPWLLACGNGVVNLKTGELTPGRATDLIRCATNVHWTGKDTGSPAWDVFIGSIFKGNMEYVSCFQRFIGSCLLGEKSRTSVNVVMEPKTISTSILFNTLSLVLGNLASCLGLFNPFSRVSQVNNPKGKRILWEYLPSENIDKHLCTIATIFENLSNHNTTPCPPCLFIISDPTDEYGNFDIRGMAKIAFGKNVHTFPFSDHDILKDFPDIEDKIENEAPGILSWIVNGCLQFQKYGLNPPTCLVETLA